MAYQSIKANKDRYAVKETAGLLGVSRSAYYQWARNGPSQRRREGDAELIRLILETVNKHHRRYGSPRVRRELRAVYGKRAGRKKAARLMRENGLNARRRRKFIPTTDSNHTLPVFENILSRRFHAEKCGQKRVSGITCLRTINGWVYLTVVIDLYDRKVLGWALSVGMQASETSIAALEMAAKNRAPRGGLLFHSDRGVQHCAESFLGALRERCPTVCQSMSRKGNCWDNACAESFFKTLKWELETLGGMHSEAEARQSVFFYIEAYYNRVRMRSAPGCVAPNVFNLGNIA
jgi:transposase InsO family protein